MDKPVEHPFYNKWFMIEESSSRKTIGARPTLICGFEWRNNFTVNYKGQTGKVKYDLLKQKYFIIAATGSAGDAVRGRCKFTSA